MPQPISEVFDVREDAYAKPDQGLTQNNNESVVFDVREDAYAKPDQGLTNNHNEVLID